MSYKGTNAPVRRLQLEMQGFFFTIAHRTRDMLEDANYMSYLADDITLNPLMSDYVSYSRQLCIDHPPGKGDITKDNMPGRRKKRLNEEISEEEEANVDINFANLILNEDDPINGCPQRNIINEFENVPVVFHSRIDEKIVKAHKYSYLIESAHRISTFTWCLYNPQFGHFQHTVRETSINYEIAMVAESDQFCCNIQQHYWNVPIIHHTIGDLINSLTLSIQQPRIQCYYGIVTDVSSGHINRQITLLDLLKTGSSLKMFILEITKPIQMSTQFKMMKSLREKGWELTTQSITFEEHSDLIQGHITIVTGVLITTIPSNVKLCTNTRSSPQQPIGFNQIIEHTFNKKVHAIPYIGKHFQAVIKNEKLVRQPSRKLWLQVVGIENQPWNGYNVFDVDFPAPSPTDNTDGLFGQLFGVEFIDNTNDRQYIRTISIYEYCKTFGYNSNFVREITKGENIVHILKTTTPKKTMPAILNMTHEVLTKSLDVTITRENKRLNTDLSAHALLNGIIRTKLPNDHIWLQSYNVDEECKLMIEMTSDPLLIKRENLEKILFFFRQPMRSSMIKWDQNRLCYFEPIAYSTKSIQLVIVPNQLQRLTCVTFHVNPLGGHYSVYYTHHRVRLRFIW